METKDILLLLVPILTSLISGFVAYKFSVNKIRAETILKYKEEKYSNIFSALSGLLVAMIASGVVTFLVTVYILMDLGSRYYGNYNHYGQQFGTLTWVPVFIGFSSPGVLAGLLWLWRQRDKRGS
jgi:hypothetical protein